MIRREMGIPQHHLIGIPSTEFHRLLQAGAVHHMPATGFPTFGCQRKPDHGDQVRGHKLKQAFRCGKGQEANRHFGSFSWCVRPILDNVTIEIKKGFSRIPATDELESSSEEFKAVNEEVMSVNDELQSTSEELERSKEELRSLNEELSTVNSQLEEKLRELETVTDDLDNLLSSINIAAILLDRELRIKRYTPAATRLFNLVATDVGRPLGDIALEFEDDDLLRDAGTVLERPVPVEKEVRTRVR